MNNKYMFNDVLTGQSYRPLDDMDFCITESDFYPPSDDRVLKSYVDDIDGGDNFIDYCEYIFDLLDEEGYYD